MINNTEKYIFAIHQYGLGLVAIYKSLPLALKDFTNFVSDELDDLTLLILKENKSFLDAEVIFRYNSRVKKFNVDNAKLLKRGFKLINDGKIVDKD